MPRKSKKVTRKSKKVIRKSKNIERKPNKETIKSKINRDPKSVKDCKEDKYLNFPKIKSSKYIYITTPNNSLIKPLIKKAIN